MNKIKVAIIGTAGVPANYGGFETLAEYLVRNLNDDFEFAVYCSSVNYEVKNKKYLDAELVYWPLKANGKTSILYDVLSIFHACRYANVLLVLGVGGSFLFPVLRLFTNKQIVVNIDGLEWKRNKWGRFARWYLLVQEQLAVRYAHIIIADNLAIQKYVEKAYGKPSLLISYGGDHAFKVDVTQDLLDRYQFMRSPYAFSVCRIEPENNIHVILDSFSSIADFNLVIVGNWNSSEYGRKLKGKFSNVKNIFLLDAIYDSQALNSIRSNCTLYIHGHSAGGTNPSLVESMYLGLPVMAYDIDYNRHTTANEALYFKDAQELVALIRNVSGDTQRLQQISNKMKEVAGTNYTWETISRSYADTFRNSFVSHP